MSVYRAHMWLRKMRLLKRLTGTENEALARIALSRVIVPKGELPHLNPRQSLIRAYITHPSGAHLQQPSTTHKLVKVEEHQQALKEQPTSKTKPISLPLPTKGTPLDDQKLLSIQSLQELKQYIEDFKSCALKAFASNTVFGDGNLKAPIMFIGEAPGAEEDAQGLPFVGLSGQLLSRMMKAIHLDRSCAYITNIVPWRPPGNRTPTPLEIEQCLPLVKKHIELISPQILVLVGSTAAKALLQTQEGIMKLRGRWMMYKSKNLSHPVHAIATFHPSYLLRAPGYKKEAWQDMLMIQEKLKSISL